MPTDMQALTDANLDALMDTADLSHWADDATDEQIATLPPGMAAASVGPVLVDRHTGRVVVPTYAALRVAFLVVADGWTGAKSAASAARQALIGYTPEDGADMSCIDSIAADVVVQVATLGGTVYA
jgi:hypothetical protein